MKENCRSSQIIETYIHPKVFQLLSIGTNFTLLKIDQDFLPSIVSPLILLDPVRKLIDMVVQF